MLIVSFFISLDGKTGFFDGPLSSRILFTRLYGITIDSQNNLYLTDNGNGAIRVIYNNTAIVSTLGGTGFGYGAYQSPSSSSSYLHPVGITVKADGSALLFADEYASNFVRIFCNRGTNLFIYLIQFLFFIIP